MTLITPTGEKTDTFLRVNGIEAGVGAGRTPIVPLALAEAFRAAHPEAPLALSLPNTATVDEAASFLATVDLIAVEFPAFSDGRGFSLARRLRRAGFTGRLRASGPLIADQFDEALACGFDEIELPETMANRQPVQQWLKAQRRHHRPLPDRLRHRPQHPRTAPCGAEGLSDVRRPPDPRRGAQRRLSQAYAAGAAAHPRRARRAGRWSSPPASASRTRRSRI